MITPVSQNEFFALLGIARFGACAATSEGIVVFWNRRAEQIVGVAASQAIGRRYRDVINSAQHPSPEDDSQPSEHRTRLADASASAVIETDAGDMLTVHLFDGPDTLGVPARSLASSLASSLDPAAGPMRRRAASPDASATERLTPREVQILRLVATGFSTEQIASDLSISVHTVRNHVRGLRRKLNAKTKLDAVVTALRRQLL